MKNCKNIVVAIDLSDEANQVLQEACAIAKAFDASIHVIHVAHALTYYGDFPYYVSPRDNDLYNQADIHSVLLEEVLEKVREFGIAQTNVEVLFGHPADEIIAKAQKNGAELIVVGSHGRSGLRLLLGSTATAVLHQAKCNVLAVRIKNADG